MQVARRGKLMHCKKCNIDTIVYRQVTSSGAKVVVERCPKCKMNPNTGSPFLSSKSYDWDSLPLYKDDSLSSEPCGYLGCKNIGTELHHYAPQHLFSDAWSYPVGYLCKEHHKKWHEVTMTGAYFNQRENNKNEHVR